MVLGVTDVVGLALTTVGVSQLPVVAGAQATWRRLTFNYNDAYLPLRGRLDTQVMQLRMFQRRVVFENEFPADLPETIAMEKLHLAGEDVNQACVMCETYDELPVDAQNGWGRENGQALQMNIENAERRMGLVARFAALRSQEFVLEMAERVRRLEQHVEVVIEVREGAGGEQLDGAEEQSEAENLVHSDAEDRSGAGSLAAIVIWMLVGLVTATVLVRVGRQL